MTNSKVKVLQTISGAYGTAHAGDTIVVKENDAKSLEKLGLVKIVGESKDDVSVAEKGSVRIADETGKTTAPATETDPKNPTVEKTVTEPSPSKTAKTVTKAATKAAKK